MPNLLPTLAEVLPIIGALAILCGPGLLLGFLSFDPVRAPYKPPGKVQKWIETVLIWIKKRWK